MKFLLSLTLFLILANAHLSMFKPAVDCAAEKTEEQLAMEAAKLERLKEEIPVACELLAEKEAEEAVSAQSVTEGDVETQKRRKGPKGGRGGRGRKSAYGLMKLLNADMCATASDEEGLATVVEQVRSSMDPCTDSVTFETVVEKVKDMCVEREDKEEATDDDAEQTEEEALVEQLMAELLSAMGKGKERKEKPSKDVCDLSVDDLKLRYDAFFSADEEAINKHEADLGWRKMRVMNFMKNKYSEDNCTEEETDVVEGETDVVEGETETDVVEGETDVVEGETDVVEGETDVVEGETDVVDGETEEDEEEVDPLFTLARRLLRKGGHRHGKMRPSHGRKSGKGRHGKEEKKENPAQAVLDASKCVPVTTDVVNQLFEDVQAAVEKAKEEAEAVVEVVEPVVDELNTEVEEDKPKRGRHGKSRGGKRHRGRGRGKRGRKL